jgi:hypothetical protein
MPINFYFGYIEERESTAGYITPCVGYFACPDIDTKVQGISVLHLIQKRAISRRANIALLAHPRRVIISSPAFFKHEGL